MEAGASPEQQAPQRDPDIEKGLDSREVGREPLLQLEAGGAGGSASSPLPPFAVATAGW